MLRTVTIIIFLLLSAFKSGLSPEQQAQVQALRAELDATKKEVIAAEAKDAQYSGGAVKAFTTLLWASYRGQAHSTKARKKADPAL